jgi:beta-lactamase regulating signal transducer with metallopeptidase domain
MMIWMNWIIGLKAGDDMIEVFMENLLKTSLLGSMAIIIIIFLEKTLLKRYKNTFNYYIWLAVIIKMIMPFKIPVHLPEKAYDVFQNSPGSVKTVMNGGISLSQSMKIGNSTDIVAVSHNNINYLTILFYIWLVVAVIFIAYHIVSYAVFKNKLKQFTCDVQDISVKNIYSELLLQMKIKRKISLKVCDGISTPIGIGMTKACILIPGVSYDIREMEFILKHELMHYKRNDMIYKMLLLITMAVHWFNPLIYVMCREINRNCELSCDEAVLKKSDMSERKLYASTLVNSLRLNNDNGLNQNLITGFNNRKILKGRLESMLNMKEKKRGIILAVLIVTITVISLVGFNAFFKNDKNSEINTRGQFLQPQQVVENYIEYSNENDRNIIKNLVTKNYASIIWGRGSKNTRNIKYINYAKVENISEDTNPSQKEAYIKYGKGEINGVKEENVRIYKVEYVNVNWVLYRVKKIKWCTVIREDKNSPWLVDEWGEG